jgi:lipopolysaccharide transport system permease protein
LAKPEARPSFALKASLRLLACSELMAAPVSRSFLAGLNPLVPLRLLSGRRELLWQFTKRNFEARHKGSLLGMAWSVLNPLLMLGLYFVVFGMIFPGDFGGIANARKADFALALLTGLTIFHFLSEVINQSPTLIVANPNLVKKVVFPVEIIPAANLGACLVNFAVCLLLVVVGQAIWGRLGAGSNLLWLPVLVTPVVLLGFGLAWFFAGVGVFLRDVAQTTQFLSLVLMYVSAVFFPVARIQEYPLLWEVLKFNPVLQAIRLCRETLLWHHPVDLLLLGWLYAAGVAVFAAGYACFAWLRPSFADVL